MTQGHNLQGVCCLSARLGAGPSLPHRSPQQLPQPRGVWPLLHEGRYIWGNLYRNKFIRIIGGPGLEPLSPSLWEHSGAGGTQPAEVMSGKHSLFCHLCTSWLLYLVRMSYIMFWVSVYGGVYYLMSVSVGVRGQVWDTVSGHWPPGRGS